MVNLASMDNNVIIRHFSNLNWREFACGWGAAVVNVSLTYPINKIIFRQMLNGYPLFKAYREVRGEGIYTLYRGVLPPLCQKTLCLSLMFGIYEEVRRPLMDDGVNKYVAKSVAGIVAGTTEAIFMPFERIQTLLANPTYHNVFKNTGHALRVVGFEYGFREYYRGLFPILLRNGPSNVGFFIIREELQERMPSFNNKIHQTICEFVCGASIGVFLSSLFYPFNVAKTAMQSKLGGENENPFKVLLRLYVERGGKIKYIYRGVQTNCSRAFLSWGVMNAAYENLKTVLY